jgi:hypothetical protein
MSQTLSTVASKQFDALVKQAFQGAGLLRNAVTVRTGVVGNQYNFRAMGKGLASQRTAPSSDSVPMNIAHSLKTVTLTDWDADEYTDIFNSKEVNFSEVRELAQVIAKALGRRLDQLVIDSMINAGAYGGTVTAAIGGADTNMNIEKLIAAAIYLDDMGVPMEGRHIALSAKAKSGLLRETETTSADYNTVKALVKGEIDTFMGFKFHLIETRTEGGLPVAAGDVRSCFAWHDSSVGLAVGMEPSTKVDWIPQKKSWLSAGSMKAGAVARDTDGIIKILCDETGY